MLRVNSHQAQPQVIECRRLTQQSLGCGAIGGRPVRGREEQHIGSSRQVQVALQPCDGHEDGSYGLLLRPQGELAHPVGRQRLAGREAYGTRRVAAAPCKRVRRDGRWLLHPQQQAVVCGRAEFSGQAGADERLPARGRLDATHAVEAEERRVDAVHLHARGLTAARLVRDRGLDYDERCGIGELRRETIAFFDLIGERLPEKPLARDGEGRPAEPLVDKAAQAGSHRLADNQRSGQHRHGDCDACDHSKVGAPVVAEPAEDQRAW